MKKERTKGFISGVAASVLVFSLVGTAAATIGSRTLTANYNDIKIEVDGKQITPTDANGNTVEPFAIDGTTYLPVRAVGNALGMVVDWDSSTATVLLKGREDEGQYGGLETYKTYSVPSFEAIVGAEALVESSKIGGGSYQYVYDRSKYPEGVEQYGSYHTLLLNYGFEFEGTFGPETYTTSHYENKITQVKVEIQKRKDQDVVTIRYYAESAFKNSMYAAGERMNGHKKLGEFARKVALNAYQTEAIYQVAQRATSANTLSDLCDANIESNSELRGQLESLMNTLQKKSTNNFDYSSMERKIKSAINGVDKANEALKSLLSAEPMSQAYTKALEAYKEQIEQAKKDLDVVTAECDEGYSSYFNTMMGEISAK